MTTNDDNIKWVVERLQALHQEHEDARRANREVDHAACRIASESYLQELLRAYDRLDEAQAEIERLQAELLTAHRTWAERCSAWSDSVEEAEAQRDYAYRAGQEAMRERAAAVCAARHEEHEQRLWAGPPAERITDRVGGMADEAEQCAVAIRTLEVHCAEALEAGGEA